MSPRDRGLWIRIWFNVDPDPGPESWSSIFPNCGSGYGFASGSGSWSSIFPNCGSGSKIGSYLSLVDLHKGRTSCLTGEAFSPQKRTSISSKHENSLLFSIYLWVIFSLLDPDPATGISVDPCGSGSGTTTLDAWNMKILYFFLYICGSLLPPPQINVDPCGSGSTTLWRRRRLSWCRREARGGRRAAWRAISSSEDRTPSARGTDAGFTWTPIR